MFWQILVSNHTKDVAALSAPWEFVAEMNPWATASTPPALLHEIKTAGKWQVKLSFVWTSLVCLLGHRVHSSSHAFHQT